MSHISKVVVIFSLLQKNQLYIYIYIYTYVY